VGAHAAGVDGGVAAGAGAPQAVLQPPNLAQLDEEGLARWCAEHRQRLEFWQELQRIYVSAVKEDDADSEMASEYGDAQRDELESLRKRAREGPLEATQQDRMEKLLVKSANCKAVKRLRTIREDTASSFGRVLQQAAPAGGVAQVPVPADGVDDGLREAAAAADGEASVAQARF
jgi:DNA-binding transcriptional regulator YbjK